MYIQTCMLGLQNSYGKKNALCENLHYNCCLVYKLERGSYATRKWLECLYLLSRRLTHIYIYNCFNSIDIIVKANDKDPYALLDFCP
jgi:hypothetical protein